MLVYSPVGCVQDSVQIEHFVKNIYSLYTPTGAVVLVIAREQPGAMKMLCKGLTHQEFLCKLREEIAKIKNYT